MTPALRPFVLGEGFSVQSPPRLRRVGEIARQMLAADIAVVDRLDRPAFVLLDAAAFLHPFDAGAGEALLHVDGHVRIAVHARRVVDRQRRFARRRIEIDLAHRHAQFRRRIGPRVDLARSGQRPGGDLGRDQIGGGDGLVHDVLPAQCDANPNRTRLGAKSLSLRRHDPDQVQRVFLSPYPGTPRNGVNVGAGQGLSMRAVHGFPAHLRRCDRIFNPADIVRRASFAPILALGRKNPATGSFNRNGPHAGTVEPTQGRFRLCRRNRRLEFRGGRAAACAIRPQHDCRAPHQRAGAAVQVLLGSDPLDDRDGGRAVGGGAPLGRSRRHSGHAGGQRRRSASGRNSRPTTPSRCSSNAWRSRRASSATANGRRSPPRSWCPATWSRSRSAASCRPTSR